jgi:hypothetical protein
MNGAASNRCFDTSQTSSRSLTVSRDMLSENVVPNSTTVAGGVSIHRHPVPVTG